MKIRLSFLLLLFLSLNTKAQSTLLNTAKRALNSKFVISNYNKSNSENGVIVLEELHNKQLQNAAFINRINLLDSSFNKIALEGLYRDFNCHRFIFDDSTKELQKIYDNLILSYLRSGRISNAEYLFLTKGINLLKTEDSLDFSTPDPLSNIEFITPNDIEFTSCENYIDYLHKRYQTETNARIRTSIKAELDFYYIVSKRTDTISSYTRQYYNSHGKLFAIIGESHSSKFIANLKQADIPFVVLSEIENINFLRNVFKDGERKPEPVIDKPEFQEAFQIEFLERLYAYQLNTGRTKWLSSISKILLQFDRLQDIKLNANRSLSYKLNGRSFTKLPTSGFKEEMSQKLDNESYYAEINRRAFEVPEQVSEVSSSVDNSLVLENVHERLSSALKEYLSSADYLAKRDNLKYAYPNSYGIPGASNETDWTDKILPEELNRRLSNTIQIQNSISKGKRPDWTLTCNNENWLGEVKYIRNKSSFDYAFKLLYDDQVEKYISDSLLNPQMLSLIILVDYEGLLKSGVPEWKLDYFKALLDVYINMLHQRHGIPFKFEMFRVFIKKKMDLQIG